MSCPNWGGVCGHIRAIDKKMLPVSGEIWFFFTRASPRVGIIDILDQGGLALLLTSHHAESGDLKKGIFEVSMQKHAIHLCDH